MRQAVLTGISIFCTLAGLPYLNAQNCGDSVTSDVVLMSDLGPCPGDGLVAINQGNLTIDLNGFSILGSGTGTGIRIVSGRNILVKGRGTISSLAVGVSIEGARVGSNAVEVRDTAFSDVTIGVFISMCGSCRVIDNGIQGQGGTGEGISVSESSQIKIRGNQVSAFAAGISQRAGIGSSMTIVGNTVATNTEGIVAIPMRFSPASLVINANTISGNTGNGMRLANSTLTLDGNFVMSNGGDGILVQNSLNHTLQDNIVTGSGGRGIALETSPSASGKTIDNEARGSGVVDLYWDGSGSSCWSQNLFDTSQPNPLPACP